MQKITESAINKLINRDDNSLVVTIYMPLHDSNDAAHLVDDQIRLKNLIHEAIDKATHNDLIQQLHQALENFTAETSDDHSPGLLLCVTDEESSFYALPIDTDEYVAVDHNFHLTPALGLMQDAQDYLVLLVAQHQPKLFKGDLYGLQIYDAKFPHSLESGLNLDEPGARTENAQSASGGAGGFNGRGGAKDSSGHDRMHFWRMIDKVLHDQTDNDLPLILAGTESEIAEYRSVSKYPHLLDAHLSGSHPDIHPEAFFQNTQAIIASEIIDRRHQQLSDEYYRLKGTQSERVAADTTSITAAAAQGRVDTLLVRMSKHTADTIRNNLTTVSKLVFPKDGIDNAMNDLVINVRKMSGKAVAMDSSEMPNGTQMAAIMRY